MTNIKCKVTFERKLWPKTPINPGEFGIMTMKVVEELEGTLEKSPQGTITVKGNFCALNKGEVYTLTAKGEFNPKYNNTTYSLIYIASEMDFTKIEDQRTFLAWILSDKQLDALYKEHENPFELVKNGDIESLVQVKGIGRKTAEKILAKYTENIDYAEALVKLGQYGITQNMIKKLSDSYGSPSILVQTIEKNVYLLADDVKGIGFAKCDEIALKMGLPRDSKDRVKAYVLYCLKKEGENGNSWSYTARVGEDVQLICNGVTIETVRSAFKELVEDGEMWCNEDQTCVAHMGYRELELSIYNELVRIHSGQRDFNYSHWESVIQDIERVQGWKYTEEQKQGVYTVLCNPLTVVTGLAGTGKSTVTNAMIEILKDYQIKQCALSGRAAQRMSQLNGLEANTIHKTLGLMQTGKETIAYNKDNPLPADIVLLDEASMVNGTLFLKLLQAIRTGTKLVIIGDRGQLPALGNCNVFFDLFELGIPVVELTTVHRQAQESAIVSKSVAIRRKEQLFNKDFVGVKVLGIKQDLELSIHATPAHIKQDIISRFIRDYKVVQGDLMRVQTISPMRERGELSCRSINESIQYLLHRDSKEFIEVFGKRYYIGDKVINNRNGKTSTSDGREVAIFNGNIGLIIGINKASRSVTIKVPDVGIIVMSEKMVNSHLDLAYCITCHKLQGSSAERVIIGFDPGCYTMICAEWIYTAITRAEKFCTVVADNQSFRMGVGQTQTNKKRTFLQYARI